MPLPDESRPGKASDLIRRFQAQVDATKEAPLVPSSSFATPGKPRLSAPLSGATAAPVERPVRRSLGGASLGDVDEKPLPAPPVEEEAEGTEPVVKADEEGDEGRETELVTFRSAGLSEKPTLPPEQQGRKNANNAFPDMQQARPLSFEQEKPAEELNRADELELKTDDPVEEEKKESASSSPHAAPLHPHKPNVPFPIVTQPSLDVPPPAPVPGSADLLSGEPSPTDEPASVEETGGLSPRSRSPSTPKAKEGLSRPTSPAANDEALRVPPTRDDDSPPPPSPPLQPIEHMESPPSQSPSINHRNSLSPTVSRAGSRGSSPRPERGPATRGVMTPTASSLAKARPRVSSAASSPTRTRSPAQHSGSSTPGRRPSSTFSATSPSLTASPVGFSAPNMSPSASRDSVQSASRFSPALSSSASIGRERSGSVVSTASRRSSTAGAGGGPGATPRKSVPTTGTPRSRKAAAAAAELDSSSDQAKGKSRATDSPTPVARAKTPSVAAPGTPAKKPWGAPSSSSSTPAKSPTTSPTATRTSSSPASASSGAGAAGTSPARGRGSLALRRPAGRGRIGLAGARTHRHSAGVPQSEETSGEQRAEEPKAEEELGANSESSRSQEEQNEHPTAESSAASSDAPPTTDGQSTDSIPVFKGFGSRPVGKIGIPGDVDAEGHFHAKMADEVQAGHEAAVEEGGSGESAKEQ
ncbi:hypothetical protein JCM10213v2_001200 [Rhodosporidiobolus nylandii]